MPPCCSAGGIFSVALSVTEPHRIGLNPTPHAEACNSALQRSLRGRPLALPGALPLFVTGSCEPTTTVSGLSSRPDCSGPAITRPARQFHYRPKSSLGSWRAQFLLTPRHPRNRQFGFTSCVLHFGGANCSETLSGISKRTLSTCWPRLISMASEFAALLGGQ